MLILSANVCESDSFYKESHLHRKDLPPKKDNEFEYAWLSTAPHTAPGYAVSGI